MNDRSDSQWTTKRLAFLAAGAAIVVVAAFLIFNRGPRAPDPAIASGSLPTHLSNTEFWNMVTAFSEPGGYFHSDNFLSNEIGYQEIIPNLRQTVRPGGAYLGVGPEQNFTYISALHPRIAFIVDIRRQNLIEQLLYKAFMELASDRANFISLLFARPRPSGLGRHSTANDLFRAFESSNPNSHLFESNLLLVFEHLKDRDIPLSFGDQTGMRKVYRAFFESGPDLSYSFTGNSPIQGRGMPSYSELMTATDGNGTNWGYLATEEQFKVVQQLEKNNLIVPLVGDFAGDKAIREVGRYVKDHGGIVTAFYLSNVEQYLFQQGDDWSRFYSNAATLPTDSTSTFIRSGFIRSSASGRGLFPRRGRFLPMRMFTTPIDDLLRAFHANEIHSYGDVLEMADTIN